MTTPKLVDTEGGKGLKFLVEGQGENHWVLISRELLDDEVGSGSDVEARKSWVEDKMSEIMKAYKAKTSGGMARVPFNRIVVERAE